MKIIKIIQLKIVICTAVKYRCILHGNVFVMKEHDNETKHPSAVGENERV